MTKTTKFLRPALLEGNSKGKLPYPKRTWIKWWWPISACLVALGSYWGVQHIEAQIESAAPQILEAAGIDSSGLTFDADYRNVEVSGTLPENNSDIASDIKVVLATYQGNNGESIRNATVSATAPVALPVIKASPKPASPVAVVPEPVAVDAADPVAVDVEETTEEPESVIVSARIVGENITLTGTVPSNIDIELLKQATLKTRTEPNISNELTASNLAPTSESAEKHINDLATILSNLKDEIVVAQINLDNDLITGHITTYNENTLSTIKAMVPDALINVLVEEEPQPAPVIAPLEIPEAESIDPLTHLQNELSWLSEDIQKFVVFGPSSDVLQSSASQTLDQIVAILSEYRDASVEIAGHTDSSSSPEYNLDLSQRRADAVAQYLIDNGVDALRLQAIGFGESHPIATNENPVGRAQNRRVEFRAY